MTDKSNILTVKQLNLYVKSLLEGDLHLANVTVQGELSNFKNHYASGHWYFTLKDKDASIRCVMFRSFAQTVKFNPFDGMSVVLRGSVSVYEKDGQYQLYVQSMNESGIGDLALQFLQIKEKLESEGLFDAENKRPICKFPKRIAVVTSDTGAAVKDIFNILSERYPIAEVIMCPVTVQGDSAPADIIAALDRLYTLDGIDTVIIGRGGGSAEDLSVFNNEALARKIYESPFPVISGVGHETDFSICDFVADLRASTPSHAAQLATPDFSELQGKVDSLNLLIKNALDAKLSYYNQRCEIASPEGFLKHITSKTNGMEQNLDYLTDRLNNSCENFFAKLENKVSFDIARLEALSPLKTLSRGFTAVKKDGAYISGTKHLNKGDSLSLVFSDGTADCTVNSVNREEQKNG